MPTPLDAERARLRAEGHTDAEISQILIAREAARSSPQGSGAAPVQGNMTGVLGNASAVLSHLRGTIPAIKADATNVINSGSSRASRTKSAAALVGVAVIVVVFGYALYQEWQIHIVNAPITSAADARIKANEAKVSQQRTLVDTMVRTQADYDRDLCGDPETRRLFCPDGKHACSMRPGEHTCSP